MNREIIYVPQEQIPVFGFATPEKQLQVKDFPITCTVLNSLQAVGKWYLVTLWICTVYISLILIASAFDIAIFLIIKNLFALLWTALTNSATGILGKAAKVLGFAAGIFLVFVFIRSGVWERYYAELLKVLGW